MQQLTAQVLLTIPEDKILVDKVEYLDLKEQASLGSLMSFKWFKEKTGIKRSEDLNKWILLPFRDELDFDTGGFVHYPEKQGDPWKFLKNPTEHWLEDNYGRVYQIRRSIREREETE